MKYFFAYGIHLDDGKLTSICPNIKKIGKGILNNYELEFRVYLNVNKKEGSKVMVGIYEINEKDEKILDRYKGYPAQYKKEAVNVNFNGKILEGFIYILNYPRRIESPNKRYLDKCKKAYEASNINDAELKKAYFKSKSYES